MGSLFSGIGGLDLGLERAGMRVVWQVENDPFRQAVLEKHWPEVKRYGDIRTIDPAELEPVDLVAGGPPCQPVSLAGKRRGKADDRWLWDETIRIVAGLRPRWCLFENPTGFISMGLDDVLSALEALGYSCRAAVIPACAVGAPHIRSRIWVVAYSPGVERQSGAEKQGVLRRVPEEGEERNNPDGSGEAQSGKDVAHAEGAERQRTGIARDGRDGFADGGRWKAQSGVGEFAYGVSSWLVGHRWPALLGCEQYDWEPPRLVQGKIPYHRQKLQALGDAVVPQVAEAIGRAIMQAHLMFRG